MTVPMSARNRHGVLPRVRPQEALCALFLSGVVTPLALKAGIVAADGRPFSNPIAEEKNSDFV